MSNDLHLKEEDVRSIIRILGEVCSSPGDQHTKKRQLMDGLCQLIDADSWAWGLASQVGPDGPSIHISLLHSGFTEETYAAFTRAYAHPEMSAVHRPFAGELASRKCHLTRLRQQFDPTESYKRTGAGPYWERADINGVIMSMRPIGNDVFSIIGIYRRFSAPPFSEYQNRIAHIVLRGVPWLHEQGWPEDSGESLPRLSPRQRMTMGLLIQGYARSQIAAHLEISPHTANDYVKVVFNHFGVHSQAALIAHFQQGDGGDLPRT